VSHTPFTPANAGVQSICTELEGLSSGNGSERQALAASLSLPLIGRPWPAARWHASSGTVLNVKEGPARVIGKLERPPGTQCA
jgi:hypothetical protein